MLRSTDVALETYSEEMYGGVREEGTVGEEGQQERVRELRGEERERRNRNRNVRMNGLERAY